jgi:lysophospholipase L1-like esterase
MNAWKKIKKTKAVWCRALWALSGITLTQGCARAASTPADAAPASAAAMPAIFVVGDSTARNNANGARGWGDEFAKYFEPAKVAVHNRAMAGRSTRTYIGEGRWDNVLKELKAGDFVLIQMGHNDAGPVGSGKDRASLPGLGEETQEVAKADGTKEVVHTYGWYLRKFIADTKAKGATPILMSLTVRNIWKEGHVERGSGRFRQWIIETAKAEGVQFVDVTNIIADQYEKMGEENVKAMFGPDYVHTSPAGADLNAASVVAGLKGITNSPFVVLLSEKGQTVAAYPPANPNATGAASTVSTAAVVPASTTSGQKPTLWLIGDSTVKNGTPGQRGWGDPIAEYFDASKIKVENRARGGRSSRSYFYEGLWDAVLKEMKPGDFVMMQFGHNDGGKIEGEYPTGGRASFRSNSDETQEVTREGGKKEVVHSYGWYLRKYSSDAKAKGATPIVLSMVPRNDWKDGKVLRVTDNFGKWAAEAAQAEGVVFINLNEISARRFEELGEEKVKTLFPNEHTHTNAEGADLNARSVIAGIKGVPDLALNKYLSAKADDLAPWKP